MKIAFFFAGAQTDGANVIDHLRKRGGFVAVQQGEHGIEVHVGAVAGHDCDNDAFGGTFGKKIFRDLFNHAALRAFAHPNQNCTVANGLHVAAFERGTPEIVRLKFSVAARFGIPPIKIRALKHRVIAIDCQHVQCFAAPRGPIHRIHRNAIVNPARRVAREQGVWHGRNDKIARFVHCRRAE
ncbi:MAG: hypothetical protein HDKAJFGB_01179 [Anaerolineae bacterium]|nr:hypothetical protein [Anaerolineae bacterium]